ncbi:LysE family translocator [Actinoallomurus purpureus]|uniref:LysE family translocator n=1 Tax=Actinoallomurus purpureus TaxID=478114 RepID=UPI0020928B19|nr:LysE family translocator [Actinoallomurus purpureus]MCO6005073.1 LysE family translocator [Actinoallomurus purpureus]
MISLSQALSFGLASFILIVIPGPSVLFIVGRALAYGRRVALVSVVGTELGALFIVGAVALGIGSLVERSVLIFTTVKLAGAAYLVFLGVRVLMRRGGDTGLEAVAADARRGWRACFDGFLVGITNPKSAVFFAAVLPQFVDPARGHVPTQMFTLGLISVLVALAADSVWSLVAGTARAWFGRSPRRLRLVGGVGGLAMIGLGIGVALTGRKD